MNPDLPAQIQPGFKTVFGIHKAHRADMSVARGFKDSYQVRRTETMTNSWDKFRSYGPLIKMAYSVLQTFRPYGPFTFKAETKPESVAS